MTTANVDELALLAPNNGADDDAKLAVGAADAATVDVAPSANNAAVCGAPNFAPPNEVLPIAVAADGTDDCSALDGAPNVTGDVTDGGAVTLLPVADDVALPRAMAVVWSAKYIESKSRIVIAIFSFISVTGFRYWS